MSDEQITLGNLDDAFKRRPRQQDEKDLKEKTQALWNRVTDSAAYPDLQQLDALPLHEAATLRQVVEYVKKHDKKKDEYSAKDANEVFSAMAGLPKGQASSQGRSASAPAGAPPGDAEAARSRAAARQRAGQPAAAA